MTMAWYDAFIKTGQDISSQALEMRGRIEASRRKREDIELAPATRSDVTAILMRRIDWCEMEFHGMLASHLRPVVRKPANFQDVEAANAKNFLAIFAVQPNTSNPANVKTLDIALCALFAPQIKAAVGAAVDAMKWPAPEGLALAERAGAIAKLDKEIAKLQSELGELERVAKMVSDAVGVR